MSGAQTSTFADPNILLRTLSGQQTADVVAQQIANQTNQLLQPYKVQAAQQDVGNAEMDMMGRASLGLLNMPEDQAAAAYPGVVANLQRLGFAKNAPSEYPGHAALQSFVSQAVPVAQQYQYGIAIPPGLAAALGGGAGGGGASGGAGGTDPISGLPVEKALPALEQRESGGRNIDTQILGPDGKPASTASGYYQMIDPTFQEGMKLAGIPGTWTHAKDAPREVQTAAANAIYQKYGVAPWAASNPNRRGTQTASTSGTTVAAQGPGGGVVVQQGGEPPAPPGGPSSAPVYAGGGIGTVLQPSTVQQGGAPPAPPGGSGTAYTGGGIGSVLDPNRVVVKGSPVPAGNVRADVGAIQQGMQLAQTGPQPPSALAAGPAAPTTTAPTAPAKPEGFGTSVGAYNDQPTIPAAPQNALTPPAPTAAAPAAPGAQQPAATQIPGTGVNSPQYQRFQQIQQQISALMPYAALPAAKAKIAQLQAEQQVLMQMDSVVQLGDGRQLHTLTGKIDLPNAPRFTDGEATWDPQSQQWKQTLPGQQGVPGKWAVGPGGQQFFPASTRPAQGTWELNKADYDRDQADLPKIAEMAQNARSSQIRWQTMLDLANQLSTGTGGATRAQLANLAETAGFPSVAQALIAHSSEGDAAAAQEFAKLALASAGASERGDLGARGSLGAIKLYQQANPSLDLRPGANKNIIGMQLIAAQADADYHNGQLAFGNQQAANLRRGGDYLPLTNFDQQWQTQRQPQVYAAAMGALAGQDPSKWAKGLSDAEYNRALDIVSRASPNARVNTKEGPKIMQPNAAAPAPPPGFTVVN